MKRQLSILLIVFIFFGMVLCVCNKVYAVKNDAYMIDNNKKIIFDILPNTRISDFKNIMELGTNDGIYDISNVLQIDTKTVASGMKLKTSENETFSLVVKGDMSGDGDVSVTDIMQLKQFWVGNLTEREIDVYILDINNDGVVSSTDLFVLKQYQVRIQKVVSAFIKERGISIGNQITLDLGNGETSKKLDVKPVPITAKSEEGNVTWESSNPSIVEVNSNGTITAKQNGVATITATKANGHKGSAQINVQTSPTGIKLNNGEALDLDFGKEELIKVEIEPATANVNKKVTFTSSNEGIVSIDENGKMIGKTEGKATITATTENGKTASIEVTVKQNITDFTISLADGWDDYLQGNDIFAFYKNNSYAIWKTGVLTGKTKKPSTFKIVVKTNAGTTPSDATFSSSDNSKFTVSNEGVLVVTAIPSSAKTTSTRVTSGKLTVKYAGITKTYTVRIQCAYSNDKIGITCDYHDSEWSSGYLENRSGMQHYQICPNCNQCHRAHTPQSALPTSDATHTGYCKLCGGFVNFNV